MEQKKVYVTPEWVKSVIDGEQPESENYIILETSGEENSYNEGHIPGAVECPTNLFERNVYTAYTNNSIDYSDEDLGNVVSPEELEKVLNSYGITKDTVVITYGMHPATEREAFLLLYFKLVSLRSLDEFQGLSDGGYAALLEKGKIAFYCGTGWRATMPVLLAYENGWDAILYDGGWWTWSRDLDNNATQMLTPDQAKTCSSFEYTTTEVELKTGETYKNEDIHIFPASGTLPEVRFKSDNDNVVTVDEEGNVTAVGPGTATIRMVATDFSGRNTYYTVQVTE